MPAFDLANTLTLAWVLMLLGTYGLITRKSLILMLLSIEVLLNGVHITLIAFNHFIWGGSEYAHYLFMLSIGVAAVEAAVGLAMALVLFRNYRDVSRAQISKLGEEV